MKAKVNQSDGNNENICVALKDLQQKLDLNLEAYGKATTLILDKSSQCASQEALSDSNDNADVSVIVREELSKIGDSDFQAAASDYQDSIMNRSDMDV